MIIGSGSMRDARYDGRYLSALSRDKSNRRFNSLLQSTFLDINASIAYRLLLDVYVFGKRFGSEYVSVAVGNCVYSCWNRADI